MAVIFHENTMTWHLTNAEVSYIITIMANGQPENLYFGKKIHDREDFGYLHEEAGRSQMAICLPEPSELALHYVRQEYPGYGTGDFRSAACIIREDSGSRISNFTYRGHRIYAGKEPPAAPLPATYVEAEEEADSLDLVLTDELTGVELTLSYTIFRDYPVITRAARFANRGEKAVVLERAMSASFEFPDMDYEMIQLSGAWARERYVKTRPLEMGFQGISSLTGCCSSAEQNPFIALKRPSANEFQGEVIGFSLVYSGSFLAQAEVSTFEQTRVMLGIQPEGFSWNLLPGESFQTPEVAAVLSEEGLNGMSRAYHRLYRTRLARGVWRDRPRPILLNNWEATYFDFDEEKLLAIARKAKEAGVELFVLDDGWFGERNDDHRGLGDWFVNEEKLPSGISGLSEKIEALGLKFGLWVELEMINKDSALYRAHPDWVIGVPGRFETHSRHQHVLDFTRREVVDAIHDMIAKILRESKISYIKWDMNRYMTEPFGRELPPERQGEFTHRYILGVYDLYARLTAEFPEILFESCASGGARFDPGMLYYAPQAWCSDDTDAFERQKIQYGTSYVYPVSSIGSHVSAVPNHQMLRTTPVDTRAAAAYFGTFGYELDLNLLSEVEFERVKRQVAFMKKYRELIQIEGDFIRLLNPFEGNETAWMVISRDQSRGLAAFFQRLNKVNGSWLRLRLAGLDPDRRYRITCDLTPSENLSENAAKDCEHQFREGKFPGVKYEGGRPVWIHSAYGDELMSAGFPLNRNILAYKGGDFAALVFEIESC